MSQNQLKLNQCIIRTTILIKLNVIGDIRISHQQYVTSDVELTH